eukprot:2362386-Prorocentrum_lima.AAC.1
MTVSSNTWIDTHGTGLEAQHSSTEMSDRSDNVDGQGWQSRTPNVSDLVSQTLQPHGAENMEMAKPPMSSYAVNATHALANPRGDQEGTTLGEQEESREDTRNKAHPQGKHESGLPTPWGNQIRES